VFIIKTFIFSLFSGVLLQQMCEQADERLKNAASFAAVATAAGQNGTFYVNYLH